MALNCPRCSRKLLDSVDSTDVPLFCMFCGQKLREIAPDLDQTREPALQPDEDYSEAGMLTRSIPGGSTTENGETAPQDQAPNNVAGYRLLRFIGAGGMGNVYEAESESSNQKVAVKLLSRKLVSNPASIERFRQEGRLASQISHPRCVFVLRADTEAGRPFIVMELMPGQTLKDLVDERGPLAIQESIQHILDVIAGLIEAHRLGVIHRDVKPSNCFLTEDNRVKVGDFGLSKSLGPNSMEKHLTHSGAFLGTVLFASPEQIRGEPVGYDTDVYAVCATLYYLLSGQAPHQHDSLTAALAKAISEDPPSLRIRRKDVPAELDRVILKGLSRDRKDRWQTLEDLQDALQLLLPNRQVYARPRTMIVAYLIDSLLLQLAIIPAEILKQYLTNDHTIKFSLFDMTWVGLLISVLYFIVLEGLFSATFGKRLLKLRVVKLGQSGPPGLWPAILRTLTYNGIWLLMVMLPGMLPGWFGNLTTGLVGFVVFTVGVLMLCVQFYRSTWGYRGLHDFASGCRVIQTPLPVPRVWLLSPYPNPLDQTIPPRQPLPAIVAGFEVQGKLCDAPDGGEVWIGEDKSLNRRVLMQICPVGHFDMQDFEEVESGPIRLRIVGHGTLTWQEQLWNWICYAAPAGSPLPDLIEPDRPLTWFESRTILEPIVQEFYEAEMAGEPIQDLQPAQVWVEPNGRVQLLDFSLPTGRDRQSISEEKPPADPPTDSKALLRQITSLMLEGRARNSAGSILAPLPLSAKSLLGPVFEKDTEASNKELITKLYQDLQDNRQLPTQVTTRIRMGQLTIQTMMVSLGLLVMYLLAVGYSLYIAMGVSARSQVPEMLQQTLQDFDYRERLLQECRQFSENSPVRIQIEYALSPNQLPMTLTKLQALSENSKRLRTQLEKNLNRPELWVYRQFNEIIQDETVNLPQIGPRQFAAILTRSNSRETQNVSRPELLSLGVVLIVWPVLIWPLFAFVFRGGLSKVISGMAIVRADGRLASRWLCLIREWLIWLPLTLLLIFVLYIQWVEPTWVFVRTFLSLVAVVMLPTYIAISLRNPSRGPQDQLLGTTLVPS